MKFAISPDEDPGQSGAVAADGTKERDVNVLVAGALAKALQRCGQEVTVDFSIGVVERVARANADGTNVLVACAHNGSNDKSVRGCQMVYCPGGDAGGQHDAGQAVAKRLVTQGIATQQLGDAVEDVYECCAFNHDTVYAEILFMSNADDLAVIHSAGYAARAAEAICQGLADHYGFKYAPNWEAGFHAAPQHFDLVKAVSIYDVTTGEVIQANGVPAGGLDVAGILPAGWYVTQWALDNDTPHGLKIADVQAALAPPPEVVPAWGQELLDEVKKLTAWAQNLGLKS